jgi:ubiquinone/menaquinone biosynthesis C-methylase UbiE
MLDTSFWKKYFLVYDLLNVLEPYDRLLSDLSDSIRPEKGQKILDAGAGTGNLATKIVKEGAEVVGLDFSSEGLEILKRKLPNSQTIIHDLTKPLPFDDNYFDGLVSNNVIYALPVENRSAVFKEFYRVLKSNGKIAISNVHKGFKPFKIYTAHLSWSFKNNGIAKTIIDMFKLAVPTIKIFYYNYLIKKENKNNKYSFVESNEQKTLLKNAGFNNISYGRYVYAKQAILNTAIKP